MDLKMPNDDEEPPVQFYEIIDWNTISKRGPWWTMIILLRDPENDKIFLSFYKYRKYKKEDGPQWVKKSSFRINNVEHVNKYIEILSKMKKKFEQTLNE